MRLAEPTKLCPGCNTSKPWSEFYTTTKGKPRWKCKRCELDMSSARQRKYRREQGERVRATHRRRYREKRRNPEWVAQRRDYQRAQANRQRRARGIAERPKRGPMKGEVDMFNIALDAAPFAEWLRYVVARDETNNGSAAERLGIGDKTFRNIINGEQATVRLDLVEAALIADGTHLREVYPDLYEVAA